MKKLILSLILAVTIFAFCAVTSAAQSTYTLPDTGGIGTTIFYVIGGILVAGAVIVMIIMNIASKNK